MEYQDVIRDFAWRTLKNLESVDRLSYDGAEVYETTQLINSMLGLLVFPRERYLDSIPKTDLKQLAAEGWPIPRLVGDCEHPNDLRDLIRLMRNAIAHFNIEFLTSQGQISGIKIWNKDRYGRKNWMAELDLNELREITLRFINLIIR